MEKVEKIKMLLDVIRKLKLDVPITFRIMPVQKMSKIYNGCGPDWLPAKIRKILTKLFEEYEPAFLVHDFEFYCSDGTTKTFTAVNQRLYHNLNKIAVSLYGFFNWRRYREFLYCHILYKACQKYGWTAWVDSKTVKSEPRFNLL